STVPRTTIMIGSLKMIPQNRANPSLHCSKEIKYCGLFLVIIVLQVLYLHFALHRTTAAITAHHRHHYDPRKHVYLPNATFDQILEDIEISDAAQSLPSNGSLFCFVFTSPKYHRTRVPAVASTWLSRCDHGQIFSSAPIPDYETITHNRIHSVPVPYSTILKGIPDEYDLLFSKTLLALRFAHRMYPDFEWYYKADDDTYAIVEHLRHFLSSLDPSIPHYIGYRLNKHLPRGYLSGGAGYVMSRAALEAFERANLYSDRERCPPCQFEDVGLGRCLANLTIFPRDANNDKGQHLFFPSRPDQIIRWRGSDSISPETISFHHLSPQEMLDLELFTYFIDTPIR
ncbi:hypothetical protein PENTCL1PPCAC_16613, partial [Pristionchus entomophagus]